MKQKYRRISSHPRLCMAEEQGYLTYEKQPLPLGPPFDRTPPHLRLHIFDLPRRLDRHLLGGRRMVQGAVEG